MIKKKPKLIIFSLYRTIYTFMLDKNLFLLCTEMFSRQSGPLPSHWLCAPAPYWRGVLKSHYVKSHLNDPLLLLLLLYVIFNQNLLVSIISFSKNNSRGQSFQIFSVGTNKCPPNRIFSAVSVKKMSPGLHSWQHGSKQRVSHTDIS